MAKSEHESVFFIYLSLENPPLPFWLCLVDAFDAFSQVGNSRSLVLFEGLSFPTGFGRKARCSAWLLTNRGRRVGKQALTIATWTSTIVHVPPIARFPTPLLILVDGPEKQIRNILWECPERSWNRTLTAWIFQWRSSDFDRPYYPKDTDTMRSKNQLWFKNAMDVDVVTSHRAQRSLSNPLSQFSRPWGWLGWVWVNWGWPHLWR